MNQNQLLQYSNSLSEPQRFYFLSPQPVPYPLLANNPSHSLFRLPIPSLSSLSLPQLLQHNTLPDLQNGGEPIKHIKFSNQAGTPGDGDFLMRQNMKGDQILYPKTIHNLHENSRNLEALELWKQYLMDTEQAQSGETGKSSITDDNKLFPNGDLENDIIIPPFNNYVPEITDAINPQKILYLQQDKAFLQCETPRLLVYHQRMLEHLEQQRAKQANQQKILQIFEKQQQRFEEVFHRQLNPDHQAQEMHYNQILFHMYEAQKMRIMDQEIPDLFDKNPELRMNYSQDHYNLNMIPEATSFQENNEEKIQIPELKAEESNSSEAMNSFVKSQKQSKNSTPGGSRKEKREAEPKTYKQAQQKRIRSRKPSDEYYSYLVSPFIEKSREEPRRKNKWQCMIEDQEINLGFSFQKEEPQSKVTTNVEEIVEAPQTIQEIERAKPTEIPQHVIDDSLIDYNHLMYTTITDDPVYPRNDYSGTGFVIINRDTKDSSDKEGSDSCRATRVGDRYQAILPRVGEVSSREKLRRVDAVWDPSMVRESLLKTYFEDLCRTLGCDMINQERALKLLKRKKYKKEKVKVNISKNEKFYSKYLLVKRLGSETLTNNEIT